MDRNRTYRHPAYDAITIHGRLVSQQRMQTMFLGALPLSYIGICLAGVERFELPTYGFGDRRSADWNYTPRNFIYVWRRWWESNPALPFCRRITNHNPVVLRQQKGAIDVLACCHYTTSSHNFGGPDEFRSRYLSSDRRMLSRLSYKSIVW